MKYLLFSVVLLMSFACVNKHNEHKEESDDVEWKEMDDFHAVMADVYHPLKDSNNLVPIKKNSEELANSAKKWAEAELPEKVDNTETKELLTKLNEGCQSLNQMVKDGAPDEDIASKLTALHDTFHSIMEKWYHHDH